MAYFNLRSSRTSSRSWILTLVVLAGFVYFFLSGPSDALNAIHLIRQRKSDAAAQNPLSPPTSAFRKQTKSGRGGTFAPPPVVHYQLNNLTATEDPLQRQEKVLILTPLARFYQEYWDNLVDLSYPHEHISLGFIIPKTSQGNQATVALQEAIKKTQSGPEELRFQSITILRQDFPAPLTSQDEQERHKLANQKARRSAMARARNSLLFTTMGPSTSWILWLDGDIVETPNTLIQDLARHNKPILVANAFQRYTKDDNNPDIRPYDYNSWRDSDTAKSMASKMGPDEIIVEGYHEMATFRTLMAMVADTNPQADKTRLMQLDGVGGTALLVKAEVHRDGAMFPPFPFYHLIETEGFAKMARRLGYESWGLPNYFVYHYNE